MEESDGVHTDNTNGNDPDKDTSITWPDMLDDAPWPSPYRAYSDLCTAPEPRLPRRTVMELAKIVAKWFLEDNQEFARRYGTLAALFQSDPTTTNNLFDEYRSVLRARLTAPGKGDARSTLLDVVNEHDLANLHHAVWLRLYRALTCLTNINLHGDWGDPPAGGSSQGRYDPSGGRGFHTTPNYYGSFAVGTLDILPTDLGIEEAANGATEDKIEGDPRTPEQIKPIARALGRGLTDPVNGDTYLGVVKSFYRDRKNHTSVPSDRARSYADVIKRILDKGESGVHLPEPLTDDDFANIHRGTWLFLAHRFYFLVGKKAFGPLYDVNEPSTWVNLVIGQGTPDERVRVFEVPNRWGAFGVNLRDIDPDDDP